MQPERVSASGFGRGMRWILSLTCVMAMVVPAAASGFDKMRALSDREKAFLRSVFDGDEAKAAEYAQVANINVNAIAGEPLSTWFYRLGMMNMGRSVYRELKVQRLVFERFKQNPNPANVGENNLEFFCNYAPVPQNFQLENTGTPDQVRALREQQENARRPHIEAMASGFASLLRYGLKDRRIINDIFMGCVFKSGAPVSGYYYDAVLAPMVRAGANVNGEFVAGQRPIQEATERLNAEFIERLIRDGAQANFPVRHSAYDKPGPGDPCTPARARSLYFYLFKQVRPRNTEQVVKVVAALAAGGISPLTKYGYQMNDGSGRCGSSSFYDAVVDTGNLDFARAVKAAAEGAKAAPRPAASAAPIAGPAPVAAAAEPPPSQIGAWAISVVNNRLVAIAKSRNPKSDPMAGLRLECVAGGKLEYVPVALFLGTMRSLWIHGADDNMNELRLVNQRASGPAAATLSKEFLTADANMTRQGAGDDWSMEMNLEGDGKPMAAIQMGGFSKMRKYMLANCKS